jgi:hypothetical protein
MRPSISFVLAAMSRSRLQQLAALVLAHKREQLAADDLVALANLVGQDALFLQHG